MVNRQIETQPPQSLSEDSGSLDDFRIVDSTPPDQLEIEAELDQELEQVPVEDVVDVDGEKVPVGRDTEREVSRKPIAQAYVEPGADEVEQRAPQPQVRQYSQDEVSKMQAAWMRQIKEAQDKAQQAQLARDLEAEVEARLRRQEESLAGQYGEDEARKLVRNYRNEQEVREEVKLRQENQLLQQQLKQRAETEEEQARTIVAQRFMDTYGLQTSDFELLLTAPTPTAMMRLAERLQDQTLKQRQVEQRRKAQVPPETRQTRLENGISTGSAPETAEKRLNRLRAVPAYRWSEADYRFMRTGEM